MRKNRRNYTVLHNAALPAREQKEKMLACILSESRGYIYSPSERLYRLITVYPWLFAFDLATVQAVLCTMIWGKGYTDLVLKIIGG